ncbi:MAG: hypothetical protein U9M90_04175 [Patescibacteria group bacterium]|nr:hypothetical protein [Patescibacteria group bacterium]
MRNNKLFWILAIFSILLFLSGWALIYSSFYKEGYCKWFYPAIIFFCASIFFYLLIIIVEKTRILLLISGIITIPSIILGGKYWYSVAFIWACAFLLYFIAVKRIKIEQHNRIKIDIYKTLRRGVPIIGTALSLLIASGFYFSIINRQQVGEIPKIDIRFSKKMTNNAFRFINFLVPTDEFRLIIEGATTDEYISESMKAQMNFGQPSEEQFMQIDTIEKPTSIQPEKLFENQQDKLIEKNRRLLEKQLGTEVTGDERIDDVVNSLINKRANEILNGDIISASVVPVGIAFGIFITVRSLIWILNIILYWAVSGIFLLLAKKNVIVIKKKMKEVEEIQQQQ